MFLGVVESANCFGISAGDRFGYDVDLVVADTSPAQLFFLPFISEQVALLRLRPTTEHILICEDDSRSTSGM